MDSNGFFPPALKALWLKSTTIIYGLESIKLQSFSKWIPAKVSLGKSGTGYRTIYYYSLSTPASAWPCSPPSSISSLTSSFHQGCRSPSPNWNIQYVRADSDYSENILKSKNSLLKGSCLKEIIFLPINAAVGDFHQERETFGASKQKKDSLFYTK